MKIINGVHNFFTELNFCFLTCRWVFFISITQGENKNKILATITFFQSAHYLVN